MRGLVSFCVFGPDDDGIYYEGALKNADLYRSIDRSITCRYYIGEHASRAISEELLLRDNVEVVQMEGPEDQSATFWRFLALRDPNWDYYLFRDVDSRPIARERVAVGEWLDSDKQFHVMRDHPFHGVPMLAGMWGVKADYAKTLRKRLPDRIYGGHYQVDQEWLALHVWRHAKWNLYASVDCSWDFGTETHPFVIPWHQEGFVGQGFYGDDEPRFPHHARWIVG